MRNTEDKLNQSTDTMKKWTDGLRGRWNIVRGKLKQQYAELTDDDLKYIEGKENELVGRIQKRTGKARKEIEDLIENS